MSDENYSEVLTARVRLARTSPCGFIPALSRRRPDLATLHFMLIRMIVLAALGTSALVTGAAHAQGSGRVDIELRGGQSFRKTFDRARFEVSQHEVTEGRCRSCTGTHHVYSLELQVGRRNIERLSIHIDRVGSGRTFATGSGPYPARASVRIWDSDGQWIELQGRIQMEVDGDRDVILFQASGANSPVRSIRVTVPRAG